MEGLKVESVSTSILKDISFTLKKGEITVLFGPNGAGKTTLLNVISGIIPPKSGRIYIDGRDVTNVAMEERHVSYIFQNLALFPHLTVYENVAFPLHINKKVDVEEKVSHILKKLDILHLKNRYPLKLSGGEKQKVAIARALVANPKLLLLDEPFSSLDFEMRKFIRAEFLRIIKEFSLTTLFVTHDPYEAEEIGDKVIRVRNGEILNSESNINRLKVNSIKRISEDTAIAYLNNFSLIVPFDKDRIDNCLLEFSEENLYISSSKPSVPTLNTLEGRIISYKENNGKVEASLDVNGTSIKGYIPLYMWEEIDKDRVYIIIKYRGIKIRKVNCDL